MQVNPMTGNSYVPKLSQKGVGESQMYSFGRMTN